MRKSLASAVLGGATLFMALALQTAPSEAQYFSIQSCHRQVLRHSHPGVGWVYHFHNNRCIPVRVRPPRPVDCHVNPQRHWLPGYGSVWHRHSRATCAPRIMRSYNYRHGPACFQIGPLWICP